MDQRFAEAKYQGILIYSHPLNKTRVFVGGLSCLCPGLYGNWPLLCQVRRIILERCLPWWKRNTELRVDGEETPGKWDRADARHGFDNQFPCPLFFLTLSYGIIFPFIEESVLSRFFSLSLSFPFLGWSIFCPRLNNYNPTISYYFKDNHDLHSGQTYRQNYSQAFGRCLWGKCDIHNYDKGYCALSSD